GTWASTPPPGATSCARRSPGTCAAARATGRSSTRSRPTRRSAPMAIETPARHGRAHRVGGPFPRDFEGKGAGALRYADDWVLPGMLHGAGARASVPCARITGIDTSEAQAVPGVRAVLTARDVPHNVIAEEASGVGLDPVVMPVLADDRVRYDGEPVALIAAETQWAAD